MSIVKLMASAALALLCGAGAAPAQTQQQPWQGTFVKSFHPGDRSTLVIDLPLPPPTKRLTVERVGVTLGPELGSMYATLFTCEIESSLPRLILKNDYLQDTTRVLLPPALFTNKGGRYWFILDTPVRIYAESAPGAIFRLSCKADAIAATDALAVTVVGYLTDK